MVTALGRVAAGQPWVISMTGDICLKKREF
jgi:hypothetical protein